MMIAVKGMDMPLSCWYCPLKQFTIGIGDDCLVGAKETEYQKRPADCPLIEVPIKEDELKERNNLSECGKTVFECNMCPFRNGCKQRKTV